MNTTYKNIKIHYQITGQGEPMVLLHGFLEDSSMWETFLPELSKKYQIITIDLLGHGKTECLGYIHSMETMARAVVHVLEERRIPSAIIVGHSMGGYVALALAELNTQYVSSIILLNSTSKADSPERKLNRERGIQVVKKNPQAYTSMAIANLFASDNRERFALEIGKIKNTASKTSLQGIIAAQEGMKIRPERTVILHNFLKDKLLIAGKQDPVLNHQQLAEEAKLTHTKFHSLEGGHMSHVENFQEVAHILQQL